MISTRSRSRVPDMDVVEKPSARTSKRAFGRDITNSTNAEVVCEKGVTKTSIFNKIEDNLVQELSASAELFANDTRDYMKRPADDIDSRDAGNPLLCTEYVHDMYSHFSSLEKDVMVNPNYIADVQTHVTEKMRTILIDWMVEVHIKYKQVPETLYLTVQLIDRYLAVRSVRRSKLQLVGVACLLLASKYEEIYPPEVRDLVHVTDHAYTKADIIEAESDVINTLNFNMTLPTVHTFLCRHLKAAHADRTMVQMACYLAERVLQEFGMLRFLPSQIAAACILVARKSINRQSPWSPTLLKYTSYDEADLEPAVETMRTFFAASQGSQQQAVYRKYCSSKYGAVAKVPLVF